MKRNIWFFILGIVVISCEKEEVPALVTGNGIRIRPTVGKPVPRVSETNTGNYTFDPADEIGIFISDEGQTPQKNDEGWNIKHTYDGTEWMAASPASWTSATLGTRNDLIGYYPYSTAVIDLTSFSVSVSADQTSASKLQSNDFLYGKATVTKTAANSPVGLAMDHKLVYLRLNIRYAGELENFPDPDYCRVSVLPTVRVNLQTGILGQTAGERLTVRTCRNTETPAGFRCTYSVIFPPQRIASADPFLTVKIGDKLQTLHLDKTFESGMQYTLNIVAGKEKMQLNGIYVANWEGSVLIENGNSSEIRIYQHGEAIPYQINRTTNPVTLVFTGDGFTPAHMLEGGYFDQCLDKAIETLFNTEPYKTYRNYFNIYKIVAVSEEEGADNYSTGEQRNTFFQAGWSDNYSDMNCNSQILYDFITKNCPDIRNGATTIDGVPVIVIINDERYGGICYTSVTGRSYCMCPVSYKGGPIIWSGKYEGTGTNTGDWTNTVVHEGGGHCFGRLEDEYYNYEYAYSGSQIQDEHHFPVPFGLNITDDRENLPWQHFIGLPAFPKVGVFEGGGYYQFGVWRPELISCMIDNRFYFNAPSRELIVKRIRQLAGETYSWEEYLAKDVNEDPTPLTTRSVRAGGKIMPPTAPPRLMEGNR